MASTGLRLCGIAEEAPRPGHRRLGDLADLGAGQHQHVDGDLAERPGGVRERGRQVGDGRAQRVPGQHGRGEPGLVGEGGHQPVE